MKARESGMPDEQLWESFFDPERVFDQLDLRAGAGLVVEFGCGYGTFTIPAARRTTNLVWAFDIEPDMVALTLAKARAAAVENVRAEVRDFVAAGTGLNDQSADYALLFNLLHLENPGQLLVEALRVLRPDGRIGVMHWNYDPTTPRGPSMTIRPKPEQCRAWAEAAGFHLTSEILALPPYHYGFVAERPARP